MEWKTKYCYHIDIFFKVKMTLYKTWPLQVLLTPIKPSNDDCLNGHDFYWFNRVYDSNMDKILTECINDALPSHFFLQINILETWILYKPLYFVKRVFFSVNFLSFINCSCYRYSCFCLLFIYDLFLSKVWSIFFC